MNDNISDNLDRIAIIGMTGRFPGAKNIEEYWQNLCNGVESVSFFTDEELLEAGVDPNFLKAPNFVKAKGIIEDVDMFDASFFKINPKEAAMMDPQHRVFLECAWEAIENAGYDPESYAGRIGLYAGVDANTYMISNLLSNRKLLFSVSQVQNMMNDKDYLSTRVSYKLNLRGPSVTVQTACSTTLVAVHMACESLLSGESDIAMAGGVSISIPVKSGFFSEDGGVVSPDGHVRAFDSKARGTIYGNGAGIVVLKRMEDAIADGDNIYAVIRSTAVNNDGALKIGFTAPSVNGQAAVIAEALRMADVKPETITYIETHGTGTELGDTIEMAALTKAFQRGTQKKKFCAIGSVKSNIGHISTAAGAASLIKTVMALRNRVIPPSINFEQPNPQIDFDNSPFYVNTTLRPWESDGVPLRAGVSSFGLGGTNVHIVLEEAPITKSCRKSKPWKLLPVSAKSPTALDKAVENLGRYIKDNPQAELDDIAYTLQAGRQPFTYRRAVVCRDIHDAASVLEKKDSKRFQNGCYENDTRHVAFMFSGLGDQYPGMAQGLYQCEASFRSHMDKCANILRSNAGIDICKLIFTNDDAAKNDLYDPDSSGFDLKRMLNQENRAEDEAAKVLGRPSIGYPAIFSIEYSLACMLMEWGIQPQAMIGHSIGEYVAACLSGVFSLEDALILVHQRGKLIEELPEGAMLAVQSPAEDIQHLVVKNASISIINSPGVCGVSGTREAIEELENRLTDNKIAYRRIPSQYAFHSPMMEAVMEPYLSLVKKVRMNQPQIPYISNVTGTWITAAEATDPHYWVKHLRQTVQFADGIQELWKEPGRIMLEIGPGNTLGTLALQHPASKGAVEKVAGTLRREYDNQPDQLYLLNSIGKLWTAGVRIDWTVMNKDGNYKRIALPAYPFERQRFWVEAEESASSHDSDSNKNPDLSKWFYYPSWKKAMTGKKEINRNVESEPQRWVVFGNQDDFTEKLVKRLSDKGKNPVFVTPGNNFEKIGINRYSINPRQPDDHFTLFQELYSSGSVPEGILHMWSADSGTSGDGDDRSFDEVKESGLDSILLLVQAMDRINFREKIELLILTSGVHDIIGEEKIIPEKSALIALSRVIPQEFPNINCRAIDIIPPLQGEEQQSVLLDQVTAEVELKVGDPVVAYRNRNKWIQHFEPAVISAGRDGESKFREKGVYLITGGFGQLGLNFAEFLAESFKARLILVGPEKSSITEEVTKKIRNLKRLGAEVMTETLDISDEAHVKTLLYRIHESFGEVNGLIHAAGTENEMLFQSIKELGISGLAEHMSMKAKSFRVLEKVLYRDNLDFYLLSSSLSPILGGVGFGGYGAVDSILDAYAQNRSTRTDSCWTSINWDIWQFDENIRKDLEQLTISQEERNEILRRIIDNSISGQIVVSTINLGIRINQSRQKIDGLSIIDEDGQVVLHQRPRLRTDYIPPRNETDKVVAEIWQKALGIKEIGIHDNFFELGGNSLLAVHIVFNMNQLLGVEIPMAELVKNPSIAFLSDYIETVRWVTSGSVLSLEDTNPESDQLQEEIEI